MKSADADILDASIEALAQQNAPLPQELQQRMAEIGRNLAAHDANAIEQLRATIQEYPPLEQTFSTAYRDLVKQYGTQERTKSLSDAAALAWGVDLELSVVQALTAADPIATAQRLLKQKARSTQDAKSNFWEKGDRLIALGAGGAALGGAVAQIPGAIVGGALAAAFAWFSSTSKTSTEKSSK